MSLYDRWVLPRLLDLAMGQRQLGAYRARPRVASGGPGARDRHRLRPQPAILRPGGGAHPRSRSLGAASVHGAAARKGSRPRGRADAGLRHGHSSRGGFRGFAGHDLDALFDPRPLGRSRRDAPRAAAGWKAALRRAWALARSRRPALAAPAHALVAPHRRRLPSRSQDGRADARLRVSRSRSSRPPTHAVRARSPSCMKAGHARRPAWR